MAKRFTDTDKWKKPMIRGMKAGYKLFWLYILDECDHAGIWHVDIEVAQIRTGEKLKESEALKFFSDKIHVFDDGNKWFIPDFIEFQYGELNECNRAHLSVIKILKKYGLENFKNKPLTSSLEGAKEKEMDKDKDLELAKAEEGLGETKDEFWKKWVDAWFEFYKVRHNNVSPSFNKVQAKALKDIRRHLVSVSKIPDLPPEEAGLHAWAYILKRWDTMDDWLKSQFDLTVIFKKINDIINRMKNGNQHATSKQNSSNRPVITGTAESAGQF